MAALAARLWGDEEALTTVEYALILALVTIASITAWSTMGSVNLAMTVRSVATLVGAGS